jgi:hypothetical protein
MDIVKFKLFESQKHDIESFFLDAIEDGFKFHITYGFSDSVNRYMPYPTSPESNFVAKVSIPIPHVNDIKHIMKWSGYLNTTLSRLLSSDYEINTLTDTSGFSILVQLDKGIPKEYFSGIARIISKRFEKISVLSGFIYNEYNLMKKETSLDYEIINDVLTFSINESDLNKKIIPLASLGSNEVRYIIHHLITGLYNLGAYGYITKSGNGFIPYTTKIENGKRIYTVVPGFKN